MITVVWFIVLLKELSGVTFVKKCLSELKRSCFQSVSMSRFVLGGVDVSTARTCPILIALRNK